MHPSPHFQILNLGNSSPLLNIYRGRPVYAHVCTYVLTFGRHEYLYIHAWYIGSSLRGPLGNFLFILEMIIDPSLG